MSDNDVANPSAGALDYQQLVDTYYTDLTETLRGHQSIDMLQAWVPDEDLVSSLLGMVESASSSGGTRLELYLAPAFAAALDEPRLREAVGALARTTVVEAGGGLRLRFDFSDQAPPAQTPYRSLFLRLAEKPAFLHRQARERAPDAHGYEAHAASATLSVVINDDALITDAGFAAREPEFQGALEALCHELVGRPIREGADHGVIRAEAKLRAKLPSATVPGIVIPEQVDPAFALASELIRDVARQYRQRTGNRASGNSYEDAPSPKWLAMSQEQRVTAVERLMADSAAGLGITADDMRLADITGGNHVLVQLRQEIDSNRKAKVLFDFERLLQFTLDVTLQVFVPEQRDENNARKAREETLQNRKAADS